MARGLGEAPAGGDRGCPLRSGRSWPGCGPDVAPQRSRAWKARPAPSSRPDATPMVQVRAYWNGPLLIMSDRQMPVLRARGGRGRRGPTALQRGGDGHKLNRRVRPVHDDHLPRWQALAKGAAVACCYWTPPNGSPHERTEITEAQGSHPTEALRQGCHPRRRPGYQSRTERRTRRRPRTPRSR
jgi:hypothetical protein